MIAAVTVIWQSPNDGSKVKESKNQSIELFLVIRYINWKIERVHHLKELLFLLQFSVIIFYYQALKEIIAKLSVV